MTSKEKNSQIQGSQRPKSAIDQARFASQSLTKHLSHQPQVLDEKTVSSIWKGFGQYIAKQLRNGKGVFVPKFGNFTFSAPVVDLAGTTNPDQRDKQFRDIVFIIAKEFVSGVTLRPGQSHQGGIRPYDVKGASGIIPKVKINYTEVAIYCTQNKDICRDGCEQVFRFLSDKVRRGEQVSMEIPFVGVFIVRNGIAAIQFKEEIQQETKGVTAKNFTVNKLFASSVNRLNLQIADHNITKENPSLGLGGAMKITGDAEDWLKSNLDISVQNMFQENVEKKRPQRVQSAKPQGFGLNRYASVKPNGLASLALTNGGLTQQNKALFDRMSETKSKSNLSNRPMSAVTRNSFYSKMTNVPELGKMKIMLIATDIFKNRQAIAEILNQSKSSLRNTLSSTEIQKIIKKVGIYIEIGNIKALLREMGYNWNGASCSFYDLFQSCKTLIYGTSNEEEANQNYYQSVLSPKQFESFKNNSQFNVNKRPTSAQVKRNPEELINIIKDIFYSSRKNIYQIYTEAKLGTLIDAEGLSKVIQCYSNQRMSDSDIASVFNYIAKGNREITYKDFENAFKWDLPAGGDWETRVIRSIREWMFKNGFSSEITFEHFLRKTNKIVEKTLSRVDFHKALSICGFKFSAPEIDALFTLIDFKNDDELDLEEWKSRIYEDSVNPLQMLREVIINNKLTADDLLFKMQLRIWDADLEFPQLCNCLRRLDPTLSEPQLRSLAKVLKNKQNKVEIPTLLRNLSGQEYETVDYRNKIFREIYAEIYPEKEDKFLQLLENADPLNDGRVEPKGLKSVLLKVITSLDEESIDRFIRFLEKDQAGKINYMEFVSKMSEVSNRDHNPFKAVVQRLAYFITSNNQDVQSILKRLAMKRISNDNVPSSEAVPIELFVQFLKAKIDKKRSGQQLRKFVHQMDIDKDGFISEIDLQTCLNNLSSEAFFKNNGEALIKSGFSSNKKFYPNQSKLSDDRAAEILKQIRTALINKKIAYREAFNRFDQNNDGFLSFGEFSQGMDTVLTLSVPIKEKLFAIMDRNNIGLVDYPNFLEVIQQTSISRKKNELEDNFNWENSVIDAIKQWVLSEHLTVEEAFKCFDKDFDGIITKDDLKWSLINILKIKPEQIYPTKLDRLFRLMDFYKTNQIQLSDFQMIVNNENPYSATAARTSDSSQNFRKSFGGGLEKASTFDWKLSSIQQIGLIISKKYSSLNESFEAASQHLQKVTFEQFRKFLDENRALTGFNMTLPLIQKLFAELDPHKKGYLTEQDWINAFQAFKWNDQILIELKNLIQCSFSDVNSAFEFFLTYKKSSDQQSKNIQYPEFEEAVNSLTADRFKRHEIQSLWKSLTEGKQNFLDKFLFRTHFDNIKYSGSSTVRNLKSAPIGARTTIITQSSSSSQWENNILEKLRQIIRTSSKSFEDIFKEFDEDKNGTISQVEFRNAIRQLNLGLKSREIDKIMERIDTNQDGKIDWKEFISKFKTSELDDRLKERAKDKMARLKELMMLHMTSPNDAFRFFDQSKLGKLTYQEFSKLVIQLYEFAKEKNPSYPVIKDLFDTIDIRKDGTLDINEWQQTFGNVVEGNNKLTIRATPLNMWENSREFMQIGTLIAKNRKLLKEQFEKITESKSNEVNFEQAKRAMIGLIQDHFKEINDEKLKCILRVGEQQGAASQGPGSAYDYMRMLDVYKNRHAGPQL